MIRRPRVRRVIAVDTNLLVAAHRGEASLHERSADVLRPLSGIARSWAIPWPCVRELWTADRDFGAFPELTVRNPPW